MRLSFLTIRFEDSNFPPINSLSYVPQVAIVDNSKGIDHAERSINNLGKALNVVTRKVKANRKSASSNEESIKEMNKEMTYVKTQVVEFCGYQSSWGEEGTMFSYSCEYFNSIC